MNSYGPKEKLVIFSNRYFSRRFATFVLAFLALLTCFSLLLWRQDHVQSMVIKISNRQRSVQFEKFLNSSNNVGHLYSVVSPAGHAVAWKPLTFNIRPKPRTSLLVGRTAFRGEARHKNEHLVLDIEHTGEDFYTAKFTPSFAGQYRITVLLMYVNGENFKYSAHVTSRKTHIIGSPFNLTVEGRPQPRGITRYCSQMESGTARGRWLRCGSLRGIDKCGPWQINKTYEFDKLHGFFWLPHQCQLHHYTNHEMRACITKNRWQNIIFTGDSHTRYRTYHWVTRLHGKCVGCVKTDVATEFDLVPRMEWVFDARGTRWANTFSSITSPAEIYIVPKTKRSQFSKPLPESAKDGDLYLMNFGHWLLREVTFEQYMATKIHAYWQAIKLMNTSRMDTTARTSEKPKRFLWVNTMSLMWREDKHVHYWNVTPSPSIVAYMNSLIDPVMRNGGVQVVDAFQVSNVRLEATYDHTHYAKMFPDAICAGVVENAITNVILNALCNQKG